MPLLDLTTFPPTIREFLESMPLAPLGPGRPEQAMGTKLRALNDADLGEHIVDRNLAACCRSGLWLAFNYLDESHQISQGIHTVEGSYWHALMHRREPDYSNSKYWFRRVGGHPVYASLAEEAARLGWKEWDPMAFVDLCQANASESQAKHHRGANGGKVCREVQRAEWAALFDWCYRRATGT